MSKLRSGFSELIERFINYRKASGSWNEPNYGLNIRLFDNFCSDNYHPYAEMTQDMVDKWCAKRSTETNRSNETRTQIIRIFIDYLRRRGLTDVEQPTKFKAEPLKYTPYAFDDDELKNFFRVCDSIKPYLGRRATEIRRLTVPVFFRLLYSTGMRTTEARLLKRENVDLAHGIIDIPKFPLKLAYTNLR